jgi:hypothetical protein
MARLLAAESGAMKNEHVLSGLIAKRAEIAGQIERLQLEIRQLVVALDHVDASIRLFDPDVDLEDVKSRLPPRHMAFKGEVSRILLNTLRKAAKPMPVSELAMVVLSERGLSVDDKPFLVVLKRRVDACLRTLRKKGLVKTTRPAGSLGLWEIVHKS